jgi:selenide,water dikinase
MGPGDLAHLLADLGSDDARILVGLESSDDAAVFRLDETRALVQTVDLITPVVDDPYLYGQIAAANSLSDVFAMGARVLTAMNVVGFDGCNHPREVLAEILAGGASKVRECGGLVVGGHTIETPEMLYGLSVTGEVRPERILRNDTPRVGDRLLLAKPLGMGVLTTAIKADLLSREAVLRVAEILAQLNDRAARSLESFDVSACTDVTGFGLAGHAWEMSGRGRVTLAFEYAALPILPKAKEMAAMGIIPAGSHNNKAYLSPHVAWRAKEEDPILFYDAQTSGGLLVAVRAEQAERLRERLVDGGYAYAAVVGEVRPAGEAALEVW